MTRAQLIAWAEAPGRERDPVAAAVREFAHDFRMLSLVDGVPGYETLRADLSIAQAAVKSYAAELDRLRKQLKEQAVWEAEF